MTNLQEFDDFILGHARLPASLWDEERVRVLAKACGDRLESEMGWQPGHMVVRAFSPALAAGFSLPPALAGLILACGHGKILKKWSQEFPGQVPSLAKAASCPVRVLEYEGEPPIWTTALHCLAGSTPDLPYYQESLELALREGANPSVPASQGVSPLFAAKKIRAARALLRAGADLAIECRHLHSLSRTMSGFGQASVQEKEEYLQAIVKKTSPQDRAGVVFAAAAAGAFPLFERLKSSWGLTQASIEKMSIKAPGLAGEVEWSWPGWLAYHGVLGIHTALLAHLADCVEKMGRKTLSLGDD